MRVGRLIASYLMWILPAVGFAQTAAYCDPAVSILSAAVVADGNIAYTVAVENIGSVSCDIAGTLSAPSTYVGANTGRAASFGLYKLQYVSAVVSSTNPFTIENCGIADATSQFICDFKGTSVAAGERATVVVTTKPTDGNTCDKELNAQIDVAEGVENSNVPDDFAVEFSCGNRTYNSVQPNPEPVAGSDATAIERPETLYNLSIDRH